MTPSIRVMLALPGDKFTLGKPMEGFRKDVSTYVVVNMENGLDIVPLCRDGSDPIEALERKKIPVLKTHDPIDNSATVKEKIL